MKIKSICKNGLKHLHTPIVIVLTLILVISIAAPPPECQSLRNDIQQKMELSAETPYFDLTYYTPVDPIEREIAPNSMIAGDHVIVRAEWISLAVDRTRLEILAPAIPAFLAAEQDTHALEIDTKALGNNATCLINSTAWLTNGSVISVIYQNVHIGNYFVPHITVVSPNGGETWVGVNTIQWSADDVNSDDELHYDVRISSDSGMTFETLAVSITESYFDWNCTLYDQLETYIVEIRVTDGIYFSYDRSDAVFKAGEVIIYPTTTTTTTTIDDLRIASFIVILLVSSTVMALVAYYGAKKWY